MCKMHFNPRSLHGERLAAAAVLLAHIVFQSTLPARGATLEHELHNGNADISIHAPCTGSDGQGTRPIYSTTEFQSTLPARGATFPEGGFYHRHEISIHAPCTGSDQDLIADIHAMAEFQSTLPARGATDRGLCEFVVRPDFNPRSLHGERHPWPRTARSGAYFNPRSLHGERPLLTTSLTTWT